MEPEKRYLLIFAAVFVLIALAIAAAMIFVPIPETGQEHAKYLLAFLLGVISTIVSYFWGSSKGSADKTEIMKK